MIFSIEENARFARACRVDKKMRNSVARANSKTIEIPVSVPPIAPDTNRPVRPPGIWGRKNAGRAAPCLCCRTPMRLRRFDSEQHCSDGAKHRKSKGSRETCSGETALVRPAMAPSGRDFRKITVSAVCYTRAHAAISLLTGNSQSLLQCRYQAVKFARIH